MHAAIITGISRGLGESLAAALLGRGFTVVGIGRASSPALAGERFRFVRFDLADAARVDEVLAPEFAALAATAPESVCLLNNAATVGPVGMLGTLAAQDVATALAVNLAAVVALANLFCRTFADATQPRRIINVSSGAAQTALPGESLYCVAKAGMEMLTRALAVEQAAPDFRAISRAPWASSTPTCSASRALSRVRCFHASTCSGSFTARGGWLHPMSWPPRSSTSSSSASVEHGRTYTYQEL